METFAEARPLADDPSYPEKRTQTLRKLDIASIDAPIVDIIEGFSRLTHCFTLQSCYGHFVHEKQKDPGNVAPLSSYDRETRVEYRIAYIALCIQNSVRGRKLLADLSALTHIDPDYIQFGSPDWFRCEYINSYAIKAEPERYKDKDSMFVTGDEALYLEKIRYMIFEEVRRILQEHHQLMEEEKHTGRIG